MTASAPGQLLDQATEHHQAGRLREAERLYRQILSTDPNQPDALQYLGVLAGQCGNHQAAIDLIGRAVELRPADPDAHFNLGISLEAAGSHGPAIDSYRRAVELRPDFFEAWSNLASALQAQGNAADALEAHRRAAALRPKSAAAQSALGIALCDAGQTDQGLPTLRAAISLDPAFAEGHVNLGTALQQNGRIEEAEAAFREAIRLKPALAEAHNNLGNVLHATGRTEPAIAAFQRAIAVRPDYAEAYGNLGNTLRDKGDLAGAATALGRALELRPGAPELHNGLGNVLQDQGRAQAAIAEYRRAIELRPTYGNAWNNLGIALREAGRFQEAIAAHRRAIAIRPDDADAHFALGWALLLTGDFENGWAEYEWRLRRARRRETRTAASLVPNWNGEELNGREILLHAEQGFGDTIQFVRYARLVAERGGRVTLACQRELFRLFRTVAGVERLLATDEAAPDFDLHCPLMSLPRIFGAAPGNIPSEVPYLGADETKDAARTDSRFHVGIVWSGRSTYSNDRRRSIDPARLAPLASVENVAFHSLQIGSDANGPLRFVDRISASGDFADTAARIAALDLVISVDTAVAHLAGAMGRPVWLMLPFVPDWRWMLNRPDSPWYPTMRLFRQTAPGDWDGVIAQVADELRRKVREGMP